MDNETRLRKLNLAAASSTILPDALAFLANEGFPNASFVNDTVAGRLFAFTPEELAVLEAFYGAQTLYGHTETLALFTDAEGDWTGDAREYIRQMNAKGK